MRKQKLIRLLNSMVLSCLDVRDRIEEGETKTSSEVDKILEYLERIERRSEAIRDYLLNWG